MKRFTILFIFTLFILSCSKHNREADEWIKIENAEQLMAFRDSVNCGAYKDVKARLTSNIDLTGIVWEPIGVVDKERRYPFCGIFDGNNKIIKGLYINAPDASYQALFGRVGRQNGYHTPIVKNIIFESVNVNTSSKSAVVVAENIDGLISNCIVKSGKFSVSTWHSVAPIVGFNRGKVDNCINEIGLNPKDYIYGVGGIVGLNNGWIENSVNRGYITATSSQDYGFARSAGIVGMNDKGFVYRCINYGDISAKDRREVAGVVGANYDGYIIECRNIGSIIGYKYVGGITGDNTLRIIACSNNGVIEGNNSVGGIAGKNRRDIVCCKNSGKIISKNRGGGIVGEGLWHGKMISCYNIAESEGARGIIGDILGKSNNPNLNKYLLSNYYLHGNDNEFGERVNSVKELNNKIDEMNSHLSEINYKYKKGGGSKTAEIVYVIDTDSVELVRIESYEQLATFRDRLDSGNQRLNAILINDITIPDSVNWVPTGFGGVFDGNNKSIIGLKVHSKGEGGLFVSLYEYIDRVSRYKVEVKNLKLIEPDINCLYYVGAIAGVVNQGAKVRNCHVEGGSVIGWDYHGGLVGYNYGIVDSCVINSDVSMIQRDFVNDYLTTELANDTIPDEYALSRFFDGHGIFQRHVGGLAGTNEGKILNSTNLGDIRMISSINSTPTGGIVGVNLKGEITNCINKGDIISKNYGGEALAAGITAYNCEGFIFSCINRGNISSLGNYSVTGGISAISFYGVDIDSESVGSLKSDGKFSSDLGNIVGIYIPF